MKKQLVTIAMAAALQAGVVQADTVVKAVPDKMPGRILGAFSGLMIGAAGGGPVGIGVVIGASLGWFAGGELQEAGGLSGNAYRVRDEDGGVSTVRSPNQTWSSGDRVDVVGGRLRATDQLSYHL